jgi:glycosyltransferase involved in cell wall biosynthesis
MSTPDIAVAICTFNPDERLLRRTLAAVAAQQVPFECVIIDNHSEPPIAGRPLVRDFLRDLPAARVVVEPTPGLSYARSAAIAATSAPLLCFVDDDNEPAPDYLAVALQLMREVSSLGVVGPGRVEVDFVDPVSDWFAERFRGHFQHKEHAERLTYGRVPAGWTDYYPPGSCMVVRREVLARYRTKFLNGELWASDRVGASLSSGGDTQIVWEAIKMDLAAGISGELRIRHMIPARRSNLRYMKRLAWGTSSSYLPALVSSFPEEKTRLPAVPPSARLVQGALRIVARDLLRRRLKLLPFDLAVHLGSHAGLLRAHGSERKWIDRWARLLGIIG